MEKPKSGVDQLLEALMGSGVDVSSVGGSQSGQDSSASAETSGSGESNNAGNQGRRAGNAANPFAAFFGAPGAGGSGRGGRGGEKVEVPFVEDIAQWGKKRIVIAAILAVIILLAAYWWFHPPINIHSIDTWMFIIIVVAILFVFFKARQRAFSRGTKSTDKNPKKTKVYKGLSYVPIVIVVIGVLGGILSLSIIPGNASKYASILTIETDEFAEDIQEVNYSEIPIIDRETADLLGNKEMGTIPEYVSQFEVSDLYSQINYNQTPTRVSPLVYADLFKWLMNRENGIPAYVLVDMTTQEAEIVTLEDGQGMKYTESEPLARNIDRYVQLKYPFYMFDEKSFEIDEDGNPWWICPVQQRTIGLFGGTTISRVVLCDAVTGECVDYAIEDCPSWVDRAYPSDLLLQQYNWYGKYLNGWLNSFIGQSGVVQTTPGTDGEEGYNYIAKDDDVWVYTGVTSVTSDSSIIGFVLINQRTQEAHFYSVAGATETSAMSSAEGQVQNLRYSATFPILINVADQPTYFMALKDGEGLVKKFAMVDIESYQIVAVGDSVAACQNNYLELLASNGVDLPDDSAVSIGESATGVISKMTPVVLSGNSHYYVMLANSSSLYDFSVVSLPLIVTYDEGDTISFTYNNESEPYVVQTLVTDDGTVVVAENEESSEDAQATGSEGSATETSSTTGTSAA
jgi:hypothetical protein